jgi:hypothetical protein
MTDKGSHRTFHDSIPLPGGGELRTLRDTRNYIAKVPKHDAPEWLSDSGADPSGRARW